MVRVNYQKSKLREIPLQLPLQILEVFWQAGLLVVLFRSDNPRIKLFEQMNGLIKKVKFLFFTQGFYELISEL